MDYEYCKKFIFMLFPICNDEEDEFIDIPEAVPVYRPEDCVRATLITI